MKKKVLTVLFAVVMVATLTSCQQVSEIKDKIFAEDTKEGEAEEASAAKKNIKEDTKTEDTKTTKDNTKTTKNTVKNKNDEEQGDEDEIVPGNSKTNAYLLPLNTKVFGSVKADEYSWYSFTTGSETKDEYRITFVNENEKSETVQAVLLDEYGEEYSWTSGGHCAGKDGSPTTISNDELEPDTTYYLKLYSNGGYDCDFSLIIKNVSDTSNDAAYKTIGNVSDAIKATAEDGDTVTGGTNINESLEIPVGAGVHGTVKGEQVQWFSFTTADQTRATYNVTFVNDSPKSESIYGALINEYGEEICWTSGGHCAGNDGSPATISTNDLEPKTTYYVKMYSGDGYSADYSLTIKSPDVEALESDLVFETPFEINDTQVSFVADSSKFEDENQAKEVLKPVAEAILQHPDATVLLAGTTATDGEQASAVTLSNSRAEAVKNLLVSAYKVPASQLKTVGLGFEDDPFERGQDRDSSGNFVESEGRKNRRVVVMDAKDEIAQQILGK